MAILRLVLIPVGLMTLISCSLVAGDSLPDRWNKDLFLVPEEIVLAFGLGMVGGVISTLISPHASPNTCTAGWVTITWPIGFLILISQYLDTLSSSFFMGSEGLLLILLGIGIANFAGALVAAHTTAKVRNLVHPWIRTTPRQENHV